MKACSDTLSHVRCTVGLNYAVLLCTVFQLPSYLIKSVSSTLIKMFQANMLTLLVVLSLIHI